MVAAQHILKRTNTQSMLPPKTRASTFVEEEKAPLESSASIASARTSTDLAGGRNENTAAGAKDKRWVTPDAGLSAFQCLLKPLTKPQTKLEDCFVLTDAIDTEIALPFSVALRQRRRIHFLISTMLSPRQVIGEQRGWMRFCFLSQLDIYLNFRHHPNTSK